MRKRIYAILLAATLAGTLLTGSMSAFAAETEPEKAAAEEIQQAESEIAQEAAEAESETSGMKPTEVTGDTGWEDKYPLLEAQVEEQLAALSSMTMPEVENLIRTYNKQINLGVRDLSNSMKDSSALTADDDQTMSTVKMLRNWYAAADVCGKFVKVNSYTADMKDNVLTFVLDTEYEAAQKEGTAVTVRFTYDVGQNISLMTWDTKETFSVSMKKAALNTVIGIGTVFIVLLFLTFIISQIHWVPDLMNRKKKQEEAAKAAAPAPAPAPAPAAEEPVSEMDDLELVAVISAAIAASEDASSPDGFVVRSIRRRGRKSNWKA